MYALAPFLYTGVARHTNVDEDAQGYNRGHCYRSPGNCCIEATKETIEAIYIGRGIAGITCSYWWRLSYSDKPGFDSTCILPLLFSHICHCYTF
jgi:hypothetical protein